MEYLHSLLHPIHYLSLHLYRLVVYQSQQVAHESFVEAHGLAQGDTSLNNFFPAVHLQNGDVVFFFILAYFFRYLHPCRHLLHDFIIQVVNLVAENTEGVFEYFIVR